MTAKHGKFDDSGQAYEITPRPAALGGGWTLTLLKDGEEAGSGIFPLPKESPMVGIDWWNSMTQRQQGYWVARSASVVPADARLAYLMAEAYEEAREQGERWIR